MKNAFRNSRLFLLALSIPMATAHPWGSIDKMTLNLKMDTRVDRSTNKDANNQKNDAQEIEIDAQEIEIDEQSQASGKPQRQIKQKDKPVLNEPKSPLKISNDISLDIETTLLEQAKLEFSLTPMSFSGSRYSFLHATGSSNSQPLQFAFREIRFGLEKYGAHIKYRQDAKPQESTFELKKTLSASLDRLPYTIEFFHESLPNNPSNKETIALHVKEGVLASYPVAKVFKAISIEGGLDLLQKEEGSRGNKNNGINKDKLQKLMDCLNQGAFIKIKGQFKEGHKLNPIDGFALGYNRPNNRINLELNSKAFTIGDLLRHKKNYVSNEIAAISSKVALKANVQPSRNDVVKNTDLSLEMNSQLNENTEFFFKATNLTKGKNLGFSIGFKFALSHLIYKRQ